MSWTLTYSICAYSVNPVEHYSISQWKLYTWYVMSHVFLCFSILSSWICGNVDDLLCLPGFGARNSQRFTPLYRGNGLFERSHIGLAQQKPASFLRFGIHKSLQILFSEKDRYLHMDVGGSEEPTSGSGFSDHSTVRPLPFLWSHK